MEYSKYRFNLDMQSYISQISLPVRQHDTGIVLRINLTDGGVPYIIKDGCRAVLCARKSDGNPLMNDCVIERNTTICYELTQQTTSCSGVVDCEVRLYGADGNLITTPRFILVVDSRVVHDEDFPMSDAEQTVLDNIILSEAKRGQNETEREETHEKMLAATEEASQLAATLRQKLDTGDYDGITPHIGYNGNWWLGEEDTGVLASGYTIPLRAGQGSHSLEQQDEAKSNKAVTENSIALGEGSIAGAKGYYFTEIFYGDASTNPQIRISSVQPTEAGLYISSETLTPNTLFNAPEYEEGDIFNLICNDHFALFGTIVSITNDIITFTGDISLFKSGLSMQISYGHSKMVGDYYLNLKARYDDYTLCVPDKPLVGVVEICKTAFSSGCGNISAGEEGTAHGANTKVVGAYGHTEGKETLAGYAAHAEGDGCEATAKYSHAQNKDTKAKGYAATSTGIETEAEGEGASAHGYRTKAKMKWSHTEGNGTETNTDTIPLADSAHAEGRGSIASNYGAHAEGGYTTASGEYSHAQNYETVASGTRATAMGHQTKATGARAVSEGDNTEASGYCSHSAGLGTKAKGGAQYVVGQYNKDNSDALFIVGNGTSDTDRSNAFEVLKDGVSVYEGKIQVSTGKTSCIVSTLPNGGSGSGEDTAVSFEIPIDFKPLVVYFNSTGGLANETSVLGWVSMNNSGKEQCMFSAFNGTFKFRYLERGTSNITTLSSSVVDYIIMGERNTKKYNTVTLVDSDGYRYGPYEITSNEPIVHAKAEYVSVSGANYTSITYLIYLNELCLYSKASANYAGEVHYRGLSTTPDGSIEIECTSEGTSLQLETGKDYVFYIVTEPK